MAFADQNDFYRHIHIQQICADIVNRDICFESVAVKKFEKHHDTDLFTLVLSQKQDKLDEVSFEQEKPKDSEQDDSSYFKLESENIKEKKVEDAPPDKSVLAKAPGADTNKLDLNLAKKYIYDIESKTELKLTKSQKDELANALRNKEYKKLTPADTAKHRTEFDKIKNDIIKEWEKNTSQQWPSYTKDVISEKTGKILRKAGDKYDAHHVIENSYGGEHEWWNIHPAEFPNKHQGGIHGSGSPANELFKGGK